jgi:hypothetical protein
VRESDGKGRRKRRVEQRGGGGVFMVVEKAVRPTQARLYSSIPDQAGAKPRGSNTTTEIIDILFCIKN